MGQKVGYVRVSSVDQNTARQIDILEDVGVDKLFIDHCSGGSLKRPEFENMMNYVREGDSVYVSSMDRLGRRMADINNIVDKLNSQKIKLIFLKENFVLDGNENSMSRLMFHVFGAFAEFERTIIRERQAEGIALAKERGAYKGRKRSLSLDDVNKMLDRSKKGEKISAICLEFNVSRGTFYNYKKQAQKNAD